MTISLLLIFIVSLIGIIYTLFSDQIKEMQSKQKNSVENIKIDNHINDNDKKNNLTNNPEQLEQDNRHIIVTYKGSKYDITDFISKHPGGKTILLKNNGKNIEQSMLQNEHSTNAYETLEKYRINE
jgi:cytochrome b involved in lipid metabolism